MKQSFWRHGADGVWARMLIERPRRLTVRAIYSRPASKPRLFNAGVDAEGDGFLIHSGGGLRPKLPDIEPCSASSASIAASAQ